MPNNYINRIKEYFLSLQNDICLTLEGVENKKKFQRDNWTKEDTITATGNTNILTNGKIIEKGGVNFSCIKSQHLPQAASKRHPELTGKPFQAMGISLVMHPVNPYVPTTHANLRFFITEDKDPTWWFGGGYDLTPYYPFLEDCKHWHQTARMACQPFGDDVYTKYKNWCDKYFYLKHRQETRGIGGLFFDDLNHWPIETCFDFIQNIGNSFIQAYMPIVEKRKDIKFGSKERNFQLYRRGRYVEFNLIYDRGTLFGLQSNGRTESILMSLPPTANWQYNWIPEAGSSEEILYKDYLKPRDWI